MCCTAAAQQRMRALQLSWQRPLRCSCSANDAHLFVCAPCSIPSLPSGCAPAPPAASDAANCPAGSGQALAQALDGPAPDGSSSQAAPGHQTCSTGVPQAASAPARTAAMGASALSAPVIVAGLGSTAMEAHSASAPASPEKLGSGSLSLAGLLLDRRAGGSEGVNEGGSRAA